jgi:16S rRNA G966 N2-methylase RsmD
LSRYIQNSKEYTFLDGTAGMGGDLYYISPLFSKVIGVEKNPEHASIAASNLEVLGVNNVKIHNDSIISYMEKTFADDFPDGYVDVLWIDPPWGGPDYKKHKELDLFLDGKNIGEYVKSWLDSGKAKVIFIKAPANYRMSSLTELGYKCKKIEVRSKHDIKFILIMVW